MLIDLNRQGGHSGIREFRTQVCVIGAGAAGITIARSLNACGVEVCLVEGGGLEPDPAAQALYQGDSVGRQMANPSYCRLRYFGGTTNHWQGWCARLQPADFAAHSSMPLSGWPIDAADLEKSYEAAESICQIDAGGTTPEPDPLLGQLTAGDRLQHDRWFFSPPTRFGEVYRDELLDAERVTVLLNANVRRIETDATASAVRAVAVQSLTGHAARIRARMFVLACGGMENPRLLLLCNDGKRNGLGNEGDAVGRYFMQHIELHVARLVSSNPEALIRCFDRFEDQGCGMKHHLRPSPAQRSARAVLGCGLTIDGEREPRPGYTAARAMWQDLSRGAWPDDITTRVWHVARDLDGLAKELSGDRGELRSVRIRAFAEQAPNPDSRIRLSHRLDALGMPRVHVDWQLSEVDRRTLQASALCLAGELGRLGLARVQLADWLAGEQGSWPERIWSGCHHMGTTRMSSDPGSGVVDADCKVHGVDNLYVAGSSVFPTGGYVPPTLTIVALALRLAGHLTDMLKCGTA